MLNSLTINNPTMPTRMVAQQQIHILRTRVITMEHPKPNHNMIVHILSVVMDMVETPFLHCLNTTVRIYPTLETPTPL